MTMMVWYEDGKKSGMDIAIDKTGKTDDMYVYVKGVDGTIAAVPYWSFMHMTDYFAKEHYEMYAQDIGGYPEEEEE